MLRQYVIHVHPLDAPEGYPYVVRGCSIVRGKAEPVVDAQGFAFTSLETARAFVPNGMFRLDRDPADPPTIVEVWT